MGEERATLTFTHQTEEMGLVAPLPNVPNFKLSKIKNNPEDLPGNFLSAHLNQYKKPLQLITVVL